MMVIAAATMKGGTGKTTTIHTLARLFAQNGKRVLMIDCDPQGTLTNNTLGHSSDVKTLYNVFVMDMPVQDVICHVDERLDIIPSHPQLAKVEMALAGEFDRAYYLRETLANVSGYDVVVMDTPPSLGLLTINALVAADGILIPTLPQPNDLYGLREFTGTVENVKEKLNPNLEVIGIVVTQLRAKTNQHRQALTVLEKAPYPVMKAKIPHTIRVSEADGLRQTVTQYSPKSNAAEAYQLLAKEIEQWLNDKTQ